MVYDVDDDQDRYSVYNGDRELRFVGTLLGYSSSAKPHKARWAEIEIYRTAAGQYIVAGCGRSIVPGERDKHWAQVCERPEGVIERLHLVDGRGARYIPFVSQEAIEQARACDMAFDAAYRVELID